MSRTIKILISNRLQTRTFSQLLQAGKPVAFKLSVSVDDKKNFGFAHHGHVLVTLYVSFLIDQNLTGEFIRKMYAVSGNLFTDS